MPADTHTATDQDQSKVRGTDVGPVTYTDYTHSEKPPGYSEERPVPSYKDSLAQPGGSQFPLRVLYADQEDPVGLPEYGDHRVKDIQIYEGIRKLIQTGPGDKIIQLIYDFDSQYFVPTTLDNPMDKAIIKINNFDDDGIRMQFLSSFLVYEGRGGLAVDIANTRLRLLNDGFNIGHQEGHLTEMTGVMILTDCIRAAILVNDVDSLRQFLQVNEVATDDGVTGSGQTRYFDFMEYLGFFLMCLQWRHYEAARLLRCCVSMNYPLEPAYLNVAEQAIHWFDHMGCPKLSTPLNFPELLSNFPKHLLGLPADYELSERSQHRDLYYTVIDPSPFSKLKASALGGHEPEVDLQEDSSGNREDNMKTPDFYKWITQKFPLAILPITENFAQDYNGVRAPLDLSLPPPTGRIVDNLYLDLTGIISACCHPKHKPAPPTEEHVMVAICEYIDHLFALIRPRNLLYIAVDGVVPRAVMRHRQFQHFQPGPPARPTEWIFSEVEQKSGMVDHNSTTQTEPILIAPGTSFMAHLTSCLHYHVAKCINRESAWQTIKVIISDSAVPGEARHKVMDFIRAQRTSYCYKANTRHVLYGPDADLIMLALITHEPHFAILREHFDGWVNPVGSEFCLVQIDVLREYLQVELSGSKQPLNGNHLEATIDDWVFLYFMANCPFLPALPHLKRQAGGFGDLIEIWQDIFAQRGTYLTHGCNLDLGFLQMMLCNLAESECCHIIGICDDASVEFRPKSLSKNQAKEFDMNMKRFKAAMREKSLTNKPVKPIKWRYLGHRKNKPDFSCANVILAPKGTLSVSAPCLEISPKNIAKPNLAMPSLDNLYKTYYSKVFDVEPAGQSELRGRLAKAYIEGMCWLLRYYYKGCPSWTWFYPYDHSPLAADIKEVASMKIQFLEGQPLKPFEQLMTIFPAGCLSCLPEAFANLMVDSQSPILEYYPTNARLVLSNNELRQKAVGLPPFFDEYRLFEAILPWQLLLTDEEQSRNTLGEAHLIVGPLNRLHHAISSFGNPHQLKRKHWVGANVLNKNFLAGFIQSPPVSFPGATLRSPYSAQMNMPDITISQSLSTLFTLPDQPKRNVALLHLHPKVLLSRRRLDMYHRHWVCHVQRPQY
ncbi:5'-3' exoribonuclease 2 [Dimargaris cristalligena]|nr:5'-3' exoribonuclease 2 [Dimargaris cristalligena]